MVKNKIHLRKLVKWTYNLQFVKHKANQIYEKFLKKIEKKNIFVVQKNFRTKIFFEKKISKKFSKNKFSKKKKKFVEKKLKKKFCQKKSKKNFKQIFRKKNFSKIFLSTR